jgi:hypothetical protein
VSGSATSIRADGEYPLGYVTAIGNCFACGRVFTFNPIRVPSIPIDADGTVSATGDRKPICRDCATRANEARRASGLPLWEVSEEVYGPVAEEELG